MRLALISDLHGNRHALEAVAARIEETSPDAILCLGDVVGYGADPGGCIAWTRERCRTIVRGNHDEQVGTVSEQERFNSNAWRALVWTAEHLSSEELDWLGALPYTDRQEGLFLSHGSPIEPEAFHYIFYRHEADQALAFVAEGLLAVGHSHVQGWYVQGHPLETLRPGEGVPLGDGPALLNPGSVGQPRDGDPRAAWGLLDVEARVFTPMRTAYDIEGARRAILDAGLPGELGDRLRVGR
jgi:predicted phosphodiesterase